jgi:hypothetical protein
MTRLTGFAVVVAVAVSPPAMAAGRIAAAPQLPADVQAGLAARSIDVEQAINVSRDSVAVTARRALRIVKRSFGGAHGTQPAVHLVRIVAHPAVFDPSVPGALGWTDIGPLQVGDLAWVVVIRNATIPILGPPGGTYCATLVVLVQTAQPRWVVGLTI